jgi:hypothetical protein
MNGAKTLALVVGIAVALPALLVAIWRITGAQGLCLEGDGAVSELYVLHALDGTQLVGPYSRFRWWHPGPMLFYAIAPLYALTGHEASAMNATAALLNAACLIGCVLVAYRIRGLLGAWLAALVACGIVAVLEPYRLETIWGPHIVALPLFLAIVLAAGVAAGHWTLLPWLAVVTSFVVQTHVGVTPSAAGVALAAAAAAILQRVTGSRSRPRWTSLAAVLAVTLVVWAPPLIEQLREPRGNLGVLLRFFSDTPSSFRRHAFSKTAPIVWERLADMPLRLLPADLFEPMTERIVRQAIVGFETALVAYVAVRAVARRDRFGAALAIMVLLATGTAFMAGSRVVNELFPYLFDWMIVIGAAGWLAIAIGLFRRAPWPKSGGVRAALTLSGWTLLVMLVLYNAQPAYRDRHSADIVSSETCDESGAVRDHVLRDAGAKWLFVIDTHARWPTIAGVFTHLKKSGVRFAVDRAWVHMFGRQHRPSGREDRILHFGAESAFERHPGAQRVASIPGEKGDVVVYELPPDSTEP